MSIISQERPSDSPLIASVIHGHTVRDGSSLRPAVNDWHMVFVKHRGNLRPLIVGPKTTAGVASWEEGAEILWIKFQPGTFMPLLPFKALLDEETPYQKPRVEVFGSTGPPGRFQILTMWKRLWRGSSVQDCSSKTRSCGLSSVRASKTFQSAQFGIDSPRQQA